MDLPPNTLLRGRYRVTRLLGQGGMGAVFLAYDLSLDHEVAVKVNRSTNPDAANQFIAEARLLATLRHPNLPRVIDYFLEAQSQYLVMDYIAGEDLKTLLEQHGAPPVEQVLVWAEELGSALGYLHRQTPPVVHRDVKPGNLKLSAENEVILVDFGIAKATDASQATAAGAAGYTPGYAPPEQYGSGRSGPYSDQYAMAATLYHLLTGQKPPDAVQRLLGQVALPPLQMFNPRVPANVALAIDRALAVRPEDRFTSVDEFVGALADPNYQSTVRMPPPGATLVQAPPLAQPVQPALPARRFPLAALLGGIGLLAVVVIGLVLFNLFGGAPPDSARTPSPAATRPAATLPLAASLPAPSLTPSATSAPTAAPSPTLTPSLTLAPTVAFTQTPSPSPAPSATATPAPTSTPAATATATALPFAGARSLAFVSDRGDGKTLQVWTMKISLNAQGQAVASELTQLTNDPGDKQRPAWSPDGSRLLYVAPGGQDYGLDIFLLDLSQPGAKPVNLTHRPGDDTYPAWSPDGKQIALTNNGRGDKLRMIDLMNADGSGMRRLSTELEEFSPAWSPDGQWLVYIVFARENNLLYRRSRSDDFSTYEFLDNKAMSGRTGQPADPAFSPDGTRLAYVRM